MIDARNRALWLIVILIIAGCGTVTRHHANSSTEEALEKTAEKGPVKLIIRITPREPRLSDLVEMDVDVVAPAEVEVKPPAFGQAVGDFLVRDYKEKSDAPRSGERSSTRRFHYQLEPVHAGRHLIRSIAIEFVDNRPGSEAKGMSSTVESDPLELFVTSELGDQVPDLGNLE